ncbi:MAG TPA: hypothetical protein VKZ98_00595 [Aquaticitalea sp.]|nr:hypothetical protein [Aquaticitalea sp.]
MKHSKVLLLVIQGLLFLGISQGMKAQQRSQPNEEEPKLLFINYSVSKNNGGKVDVQFINKIITKGRLKDRSNLRPLVGVGDIECLQLDKNNKVLERSYYSNPLQPIVEYLNDDNELEKRQMQLETAQLAIKLQLNERTETIKLIRMEASGAATELLSISILTP